MRAHQLLLLLPAIWLVGCDQVSVYLPDQKTRDAQAIGFSCRVSKKTPEACIKENPESSPSAILSGWKQADTEIIEQLLDPTMSGKPLKKPEPAKPAAHASDTQADAHATDEAPAPEEETPAEDASAEEETPEESTAPTEDPKAAEHKAAAKH